MKGTPHHGDLRTLRNEHPPRSGNPFCHSDRTALLAYYHNLQAKTTLYLFLAVVVIGAPLFIWWKWFQ